MQRLAGAWRRAGQKSALVPTMGYLHEGHLSLVRRARQNVGPRGHVVVSIYVNPTQFAPSEDFSRYPRDFAWDTSLCRTAGVDVVFAPPDKGMYPQPFSTFVVEESLSRSMEGASRPSHFRGVTTVVAKLFNIVQPGVAVFGAKDYQQAAVVQRMVRDLNFPLRVIVAPTFREPDGLAMSSRNKYLAGRLRAQATILFRAIEAVREQVRAARKAVSAEVLKERVALLIASQPDAKLDYLEFFQPRTLEPVSEVGRGTQLALAVFVGATRLIDNGRV
jgi:pantoate--beta-alanine ligase